MVFHFLSIKNLKLEYHDCERKDLANFCRQQTEISSKRNDAIFAKIYRV